MARPTARQRGYDSKWERARAAFLAAHPWCRRCEAMGRLHRATVVDHIEPHKGDHKLFWKRSNWQPLCAPCHNSDKQQVERRSYTARINADGFPSDPAHPFNRSCAEQPDETNARHAATSSRGKHVICNHETRGASKVANDGASGPAWGKRKELVRLRGLCGRAG
ncbi:HNH endonuclease signature motif containing protein [Jiella avicenniae]|uniref:HNH endonuclease signature motif containing protein n=1 Tax=Jiella avicenniae TaxID=2907202 RepID=UPI0030844C26